MLISHRLIFDVAKNIALRYGHPVPVLQLDPLAESARLYVEEDLQVSYLRQLMVFDGEELRRVERVLIRVPINWDLVEPLDDVEPLSEEDKLQAETVFDAIFDAESNVDLSLVFVPDEWINRLQELNG